MDASAWETFLQVADRGSVSRAARELGVTQPGVSRQIQKLERELGARLFERTPAGVRLTPAGERCRAYAREALARQRQLLAELRGTDVPLEGELRIAASTTPAEFVVPRLVADFTTRHPRVRAVVFSTDSQGVVEELREGRWDVGFAGARIGREGLAFDPIGDDEVVLAVPAGHPFAGRREVAVAELAGERFVEREGGSGTLLSVRQALAERGLALPAARVTLTLTTTQALVSAVRAGCGVGFVSALALREQRGRRVVGVRLAGVPLRRQLYLVRPTRAVLPPVARRFVEAVLAERAR